jgi:AcrR family transcriptional regulator
MTTNEAAAENGDTPSRRDLAVARSLDPARVRAEERVQRFLDAALELMQRSDGKEFTVQEVVEKSGQSLRSFYQYFAGKHELLLALFEESVRTNAELLREEIAGDTDPLIRLNVFSIAYYGLCRPLPKTRGKRDPAHAMADFAQQLLTGHAKEASRAFVPMVDLAEELLTAAAEAGAIREEAATRRVAGVLLQSIMFSAFAATISGTHIDAGDDAAEELWDLFLNGIAT